MEWLLLVLGGLVFAAAFAKVSDIEERGFGQTWIPRIETFVDEFNEGATGMKTCAVCRASGADGSISRMGGILLCEECNGFSLR